MSADPTMDFLASLDDPKKWVVKRNVPIFRPHTRKALAVKPDGTTVPVTVDVTDADLSVIAENMRRLEYDFGVAARLTAGHQDTRLPEGLKHNPKLLGFARLGTARVGTFGPAGKPAILVDEYLFPGMEAERNALPYRSPDYFPEQKQIRGVAAMLRDPFLDMGVVVSYSADGPCHTYAAEVPTMADPTPTPAAGTPTPDEQAQLDALMVKYQAWICAKYKLATPAAAGDPNAVPEPVRMQLDQMRVSYENRLTQTTAQLNQQAAELATLRYQREEAVTERQVIQLEAEGYQLGDRAKMVKRLAGMPEADRTAEVEHIRLCYARVPVPLPGEPPLTPAAPAGADQRRAEEHHQRAMAHMRGKPGMTLEEAYKATEK